MGIWGKCRVRAQLLAHLIEGKVWLCMDYALKDIMQDLEGIRLTYMQTWRAREFVCMMVLGRPVDHYKLLPWMCTAIVRVSPGSVAVCKVNRCRFYRMFVTYAANVNGFKLGCNLTSGRCWLRARWMRITISSTSHTPLYVVRKLKSGYGSWKWLLSV